jgi:hypothetical protein
VPSSRFGQTLRQTLRGGRRIDPSRGGTITMQLSEVLFDGGETVDDGRRRLRHTGHYADRGARPDPHSMIAAMVVGSAATPYE